MWAVSDKNGLVAVLSDIWKGIILDKLFSEALVMGNGIEFDSRAAPCIQDKINTGLGAVITGEATTCCTG